MKGLKLIAGLELGERQFVLAAGALPERESLVVKAIETLPSRGMEGGVLSDPIECADAVARLLRRAEKSLGVKVTKVLVALQGNHLKSVNASASIPISDPGVGIHRRDVERAVATCRSLSLDYNRQILHAFERGFAVDGQTGIKDPVGLYGSKLTVELHLVTALSRALQSLTKMLNRAGLEVEELILPGLAASEAVLSQLDQDLGVTLIRIGELQTELLLFANGKVEETFLIPWGRDSLMESLSRNLKLPLMAAEGLLSQIRSLEDDPEKASLLLRVQRGALTRTFPQGQVIHLIQSKLKEFLTRVAKCLQESLTFRDCASGVVMVGELAHLEGFLEMAESLLNMPVRLGTVRQIQVEPGITLTTAHTTAIGLIRHGAQRAAPTLQSHPSSLWTRWVDSARRLLEEYF